MKINNISRKNTCLLNALRLGQAFIIRGGKDTIYIKIADKDNRNMIKCDSIYEAGLRYPGEEKGLHYAADTEVVPIELINIDYKELSC